MSSHKMKGNVDSMIETAMKKFFFSMIIRNAVVQLIHWKFFVQYQKKPKNAFKKGTYILTFSFFVSHSRFSFHINLCQCHEFYVMGANLLE